MSEAAANKLSLTFQATLRAERFEQVGTFDLDENGRFACRLPVTHELNLPYSLYAFVGRSGGGNFLRIGKSEEAVFKRLGQYSRYINEARDSRLGINGFWAGGTKPWERDGWFGYLAEFGAGMICVRAHEGVVPTGEELTFDEKALRDKYRPPLCNDTAAGRALRSDWQARHGKSVEHRKRSPA